MDNELITCKELLDKGNNTFVMANNGSVTAVSEEKGLRPILDIYRKDPYLFNGSSVADKVIGKAAALLLAGGKIKQLYAEVISRSASDYLSDTGVPFSCGTISENIMNRDGSDLCPMEKLCADVDDPSLALEKILTFIKS